MIDFHFIFTSLPTPPPIIPVFQLLTFTYLPAISSWSFRLYDSCLRAIVINTFGHYDLIIHPIVYLSILKKNLFYPK